MDPVSPTTAVSIACGGTGGHLFPGLAVADQLASRGCQVTLLISPKEVDQTAVKQATQMRIATLPAVGLTRGRVLQFSFGFLKSFLAARKLFAAQPPAAVLAMGGFTSAPPVLAGKRIGAAGFLHESNSIPGRANRWLSRFVDHSFVGYPSAARQLHGPASVTGTPVRAEFGRLSLAACRAKLGLDPTRNVLLVMGGSQGASAINSLVLSALEPITSRWSDLQIFHITGPLDQEKVAKAYAVSGIRAHVHAFFADMASSLGSATVVLSRAGASSLAEIAAVRVPSILIPFPAAVDNHQYFNALALANTGAAVLLEQAQANSNSVLNAISLLLDDPASRKSIADSLAQWHAPTAAGLIADAIMERVQLGKKSQEDSNRAVTPSVNQRHSALA